MRCITIVRSETKFIGTLIKYYCFLNVDYRTFEQYITQNEDSLNVMMAEINDRFLTDSMAQMIPISMGKSIEIKINEQQNEMFAVAFTSTGASISNLQIIKEGKSDASYRIKTDYSWTKGTKLALYEV